MPLGKIEVQRINMNIGVFGKGKTGSEVIELLDTGFVFDSKNLPSNDNDLDALIIFIPPNAFIQHQQLLLSLTYPLIIGTTGIEWTKELKKQIKQNKRTWIYASNFSLGMLLVRKAIEKMNSLLSILDDPILEISETHHTNKKDAPSGTALLWNEWLGGKSKINSTRQGDVIGLHEARIITEQEKITIKHEALDRKLFAQGAVWCANITTQKDLIPGLYSFEKIVDEYLKEKNV
jgi:4-hydroxy-tetrahydrodipicolinate reductase